MIATLGLAALAGLLSVLSPCVLPLLPLVLGAAAAEHRLGPAALAAGLALSFTGIGLFVATLGFAFGLDDVVIRRAAAGLLVAVGLVLLVPVAQARLAAAAGPLADAIDRRFGRRAGAGLAGQFGLGLVLGAIWSPCVGPTLGAASLLAAQGRDLAVVAATMAAFGIGAGLPLLVLGTLSRGLILRGRGGLMRLGQGLKAGLGLILVLVGLSVLTGLDKALETALVEASPDWLTALTTRF